MGTGLRLLVCLALLAPTGCAAVLLAGGAAAGAGTVAYVRGDLESTEELTLDQAWSASRAALADLDLTVTATEKDGTSASVTARGADERRILVTLQRRSDRLTHLRIRVGIFGDEALSHIVLEKIRQKARTG